MSAATPRMRGLAMWKITDVLRSLLISLFSEYRKSFFPYYHHHFTLDWNVGRYCTASIWSFFFPACTGWDASILRHFRSLSRELGQTRGSMKSKLQFDFIDSAHISGVANRVGRSRCLQTSIMLLLFCFVYPFMPPIFSACSPFYSNAGMVENDQRFMYMQYHQ